MPLFKPGNNQNPVGRPKGAKDHSWAKVGFWFNELKLSWPKLTDNQRAHYSVELMKMLTSKLKQLPITPEESALNIEEAMAELKRIEAKSKPDVKQA